MPPGNRRVLRSCPHRRIRDNRRLAHGAIRRVGLLCALTAVAQGCTTSAPKGVSTLGPQPACLVGAAPATAPESIFVATIAPLDVTHAPHAQNSGARCAFAQAYETLINADCAGRAYPGLARSWTSDDSRTRVTLSLRDEARFSDGEPVRASDVVAAWRTTGEMTNDVGQIARRLADGATVVNDHTLVVSLPDTQSLVLAHPALVVYKRRGGAAWPDGSGPYRAADAVPAAPNTLVMIPVTPHMGPRLVIRSRREADARDEIDAGADLLQTADPVVLSYAAARPGIAPIPTPWDRTYLLALPGGSATMPLAAAGADSAAFRASLARDAVRGEARPAEPPFWWNDAGGCALRDADPSPTERRARIVYRRDDHVARELAERLVALGGGATAAGLAAQDFNEALRAGRDLGYVAQLPTRSIARCQDLAILRMAVPWLAPDLLIPLVETRGRVIVRSGRVAGTIDWDGTVRLTGGAGRP